VYREEVDYSGDFVYDRAIGAEIKWKDEKDSTKVFEIKKQRNKSECRFFVISILLLTSDLPDTNRRRLVQCEKHTQQNRFSTFSHLLLPRVRRRSRRGGLVKKSLTNLRKLTIKSARTSRRKCVPSDILLLFLPISPSTMPVCRSYACYRLIHWQGARI
jgi:hypothetical protein